MYLLRDAFVDVFSVIYGIGVFMIGIIINAFSLFGIPNYYDNEILNIILSVLGIIIISWLMFDIHKYLAMMKDGYNDDNQKEMPIKLIESEDGELIISIPLNTSKRRKLPQYYCFSTERHTGSFFLKIGAAVFCLGAVVHLLVQFSTLMYTTSIKSGKTKKMGDA